MSLSIDLEGVDNLINSDQAMVYGYSDCCYTQVHYALLDAVELSGVKRVFTGDPSHEHSYAISQTLENRQLTHSRIDKTQSSYAKRYCKSGLVSLVWENFLRSNEGLKPIPVIFCIAKEGNGRDTATSEEILSKSHPSSRLITHSEIRRAYKLCFDPMLPEPIKDVALKTFRFVLLKKKPEESKWVLHLANSPWEQEDWNFYYQKRKDQKINNMEKGWRRDLKKLYKTTIKPSFFKKIMSALF